MKMSRPFRDKNKDFLLPNIFTFFAHLFDYFFVFYYNISIKI